MADVDNQSTDSTDALSEPKSKRKPPRPSKKNLDSIKAVPVKSEPNPPAGPVPGSLNEAITEITKPEPPPPPDATIDGAELDAQDATSTGSSTEPVADTATSPSDNAKPTTATKSSDGKPKPKHFWRRKWFEITVLVVIIALGALLWWWFSRPVAAHLAPLVTPKPPTPTPKVTYDPLTGLAVANAAAANQPVVGVMIENLDPDARPQSGLGSAGVVYEALAEGGITRFMAIFQEPFPSVIGPVRSLRPYYLDWGLQYNIPVAHAGGSQPALAEVGPLHLKDINALAYDGSYFYRTSDRVAPHNLYTNASLISSLLTKLGFATTPTFTPLPRKTDMPPATAPHPTIDINFSYADYAVEYRYNATTDSYARFMAGTAHVDRDTGQQIMVKNIVVEYVPTTYSTQADGDPETDMNLIGQGRALVFEDGGVTVGTWNKASDAGATTLLDASGKAIAFNRGNTWFEVVPTINTVTY